MAWKTVHLAICNLCGWVWITGDEKPKQCGKCRSRQWDKGDDDAQSRPQAKP